MSRRRKHVRSQLDEACPDLTAGDAVVRVVDIRGGNQIEVEKPDSCQTLIRVPAKFSKILWVRKGTFVLAHFEEHAAEDGGKVTGELLRVLYADQIKEMRKRPGMWPETFANIDNAYEDEGTEVTGDMRGLSVGSEVEVHAGKVEGAAAGIEFRETREKEIGGAVAAAVPLSRGSADVVNQKKEVIGIEYKNESASESESDDGLPPLEANRNWRPLQVEISSGEEGSSSDDES
mmetsp:Transcript_36229/g.58196  ORF Transcript_36229/g.58196 Transcript_36229/m.58196 type:complete len:233 (+) Transcript_36229:102-800(+)